MAGWASLGFLSPCTLGQWPARHGQGEPVVFGALGVTGFGGNEWGRLLRLSPRHPRYLVSLPTRPARFREEGDVRLELREW